MRHEADIGVGIDIGKHQHAAIIRLGGRRGGRDLTPHFRLEDTHASVESLLERVHQAELQVGGPSTVTVNMEATGIYHIPLFTALTPLFDVILWQPRQSKESTKKNIRRTKTDKRDARNLALLHRDNRLTPPSTTYENELLVGARELVRVYYTLKDVKTNLSRRWTQEVFLANPGLDTLLKPSTHTARRILQAAPTPEDLKALGENGIRKLLKGGGRGTRVTPAKFLQMAEGTLRAPAHEQAAAVVLRSLRSIVDHVEGQMRDLEREMWAYWQRLSPETYIETFPSMGWIRALTLHAEFGGLKRFPVADAAVSFAGLENYVYHSGKKRVDGGMTKAGAPLIRRVLWELLQAPNINLPRFSAYVERKQGQGKHRNEAIHAASKKVVRTLWGMDHHGSAYRPPTPIKR